MQTQSRPHWLVLTISLVFLLSISIRTIRHFLHYPSSSNASEVAQWIVEQNLDPSVCFKMSSGYIPFLPVNLFPAMGPTTESKKSQCTKEVAELLRDPAVCKKLMPSESGLWCLGGVGEVLFRERDCWQLSGRDGLYCRGNDSAELVIENPTLESCVGYKRNDVKEWCYFARSQKLPGVYECSLILKSEVRDECETFYAFKEKDPELCLHIRDEKTRRYCDIRINTWIKYPQLRGSFYFGKQ